MENASKALIITGEVLIGVIILSIGVALFAIFSNYTKSTVEGIEKQQILEFNANFLKYEYKEITAYDVVNIANFAKQNNIDRELESETKSDNNTYYVQIDLNNINKAKQSGKISSTNFQNEEDFKATFIKDYYFEYEKDNNTGNYEIIQTEDGPKIRKYQISDIKYNSFGRINYVKIKEIL